MQDKKVTIYDIAKEAGVSVGTVNRALNDKPRISEKTKQLVLDTAKELGYKANPAAQGLRRSPIKIGAILFCPIEEYVDSIIDGITSSALDLEKYNVAVNLKKIEYTNSRECLEETSALIKKFAEEGYNGIVLFLSSMLDELGDITRLINKLTEKNIHFATVANDIPDSKRVIHVGIDAFMAGKMAAEILEMSCKDSDVALLVTSTSSPVNIDYIRGFTMYSGKDTFSAIKIYEHFDDKGKVIEATKAMIKENPNLKGIYMATASSAISCEYIKEKNINNLTIVTTDLLQETPALLKQKAATATIFQNPYRQGRSVVKLLYNHIISQIDKGEHLVAPQILLSSNVDAYLNNNNL